MALDFRHTDTKINRFSENISLDHLWVRTPIPPKFNSFTERLQWWLEERGWGKWVPEKRKFEITRGRQGELAKIADIGQGTLSDLIAGRRSSTGPSAATLLRLCEELRLRPHYLMFGDGPPESYSELSAKESRLVNIFRELPTETLRDRLLIDAADVLKRSAGESAIDANASARRAAIAEAGKNPLAGKKSPKKTSP
jgi:transcriptional regulator with XRE-family HTH domain